MASNAELERLVTALTKTVEQLSARIEYLETLSPDFQSQKRKLDAKRKAEEAAAKEKQEWAEKEQRRLQVEADRYEYKRPPKQVLCERTGEYYTEGVASHVCAEGRCYHDVRKAKAAGQLTSTQYALIVENGQLETGCVLATGGPPTITEFEKTANEMGHNLPYDSRLYEQEAPPSIVGRLIGNA